MESSNAVTALNGKEFDGILCFWPGTIIEESQYPDFEEWLAGQAISQIEVQALESVVVDKHRTDFFFCVRGDLSGILLARINIGFKWVDDYLSLPYLTRRFDPKQNRFDYKFKRE